MHENRVYEYVEKNGNWTGKRMFFHYATGAKIARYHLIDTVSDMYKAGASVHLSTSSLKKMDQPFRVGDIVQHKMSPNILRRITAIRKRGSLFSCDVVSPDGTNAEFELGLEQYKLIPQTKRTVALDLENNAKSPYEAAIKSLSQLAEKYIEAGKEATVRNLTSKQMGTGIVEGDFDAFENKQAEDRFHRPIPKSPFDRLYGPEVPYSQRPFVYKPVQDKVAIAALMADTPKTVENWGKDILNMLVVSGRDMDGDYRYCNRCHSYISRGAGRYNKVRGHTPGCLAFGVV